MVTAAIIAFGLEIILAGPLDKLWVMLNALQFLFLIGVIQLNYSPEASLALNILGFANIENPVLVEITQMFLPEGFFIERSFNKRF